MVHLRKWTETTEPRRGRLQRDGWRSRKRLQDQLPEHDKSSHPLSVQSLAQMGAIVDFRTGAAVFGYLTDQSFVQLEQDADRHLCRSLVEDLLARPFSDKGKLQGFTAAAQSLGEPQELGTAPSVSLV